MSEAGALPSNTPVPQAAPVITPEAAPAPASVAVESSAPAVSPPSTVDAQVPAAAAPVHVPDATAPATVEAPKVDAAKPVEAKAPEAAPVEPQPEAPAGPVYTDFKLPEGFNLKPEQLTGFTERLGKYGLTQDAGQDLLEFGTAQIKTAVDDARQQDRETFENMRADWRKEVDKTFGKDRDIAVGDANWLLNEAMQSKTDRKKMFEALALTGAGDNPYVIKALANIAKKLKERGAPPASLGARAPKQNPADRRYGART